MIIFSDFDDTLHYELNPAQTRENLAAVKAFREKGNYFCLASGRSLQSMKRTLPDYKNYFDYAILENGSYCVDGDGKNVFEVTMDFDIAQKITQSITDFLKDRETADLVFYFDQRAHKTLDSAPTKIRIWLKTSETMHELAKSLLNEYGKNIKAYTAAGSFTAEIPWIIEHYNFLLDIAPVAAGKESGVKRLVAEKFPDEKVYVIGDSNNDIEMLSSFEGYAVPNSNAAVFKVVPESRRVDSVAALINRLLELS